MRIRIKNMTNKMYFLLHMTGPTDIDKEAFPMWKVQVLRVALQRVLVSTDRKNQKLLIQAVMLAVIISLKESNMEKATHTHLLLR